MSKRSLTVVLLLAGGMVGGCAQSQTGEKAAKNTEPRKAVSATAPQSKKHVIKETEDGTYYIMMEQHERLCSDCDR